MTDHFSKFFHHQSKNLSSGRSSGFPDESEWPAEWRTIYYKTYPRLKRTALHGERPGAKDFFETLLARSSRRDLGGNAITAPELASLLKYSCGINGFLPGEEARRRTYPSAGARFPLETYVLVFRAGDGLEAGAYHYQVSEHALELLRARSFTAEDIRALFIPAWTASAFVAVVMTGVFERNQKKYGERGYRQILIEAGHMGQNFCLVAEALGLKCCPVTGAYDDKLEELLDIDGVSESFLYAIILGK